MNDLIQKREMKTESQGEYIFVIDKTSSMADKRGRILAHRWVMSEILKRPLKESEIVHHINGNTRDNSSDNLKLSDSLRHKREHKQLQHGYSIYRKGCRCELCKEGNTDRIKKYRDKKCRGLV